MKRIYTVFLALCLALSAVSLARADKYSEYGWDADIGGYMAVVANPKLGDRLNLREKPDMNSKSLGRFYSGTPVYVIDNTPVWDKTGREWAHVDLIANFEAGVNLSGYMLKEYLMPMNVNFEAPQLFYRASALPSANLLEEPRNGADIVGKVGEGELYLLGDIGDDWRLAANQNGAVGYIRASRIRNTRFEVKQAYLFPADGGGYVPVYEDKEMKKVCAKMYPGASVKIVDYSKAKARATVESFGVPYEVKNEWVWQADINGYVRMEDVTVFIQPWQAEIKLRTGIAKTDIETEAGDVTIPKGASVTVAGEMKGQYQIVYGGAPTGWYTEKMVPVSQIELTDRLATDQGPAALGFALLPQGEMGPDGQQFMMVPVEKNPGDPWEEGSDYSETRLAEIIGEMERNGVFYWQLRSHSIGNFYMEKEKCEALLYADMDNSQGMGGDADGPWTATKAEQGLWYYFLAPGQEGLLTLEKPDGTVIEYEVYEEMPNETAYSFFMEAGTKVTVQGEREIHPLRKEEGPYLLPPYPGNYGENQEIFSGSGRFYCDWQIPNDVNYFTLMVQPMPGSTDSYAAVSTLFGNADETELVNFFPVSEDGWEHEGKVSENESPWEWYDCLVFPGMFLEVHNCVISVFFGNG
ncbi:MAG: SH3 domain-containing protein [Clostridia bacterium]|nr:SH3 domain-containing protein [Clostridia bacterium]